MTSKPSSKFKLSDTWTDRVVVLYAFPTEPLQLFIPCLNIQQWKVRSLRLLHHINPFRKWMCQTKNKHSCTARITICTATPKKTAFNIAPETWLAWDWKTVLLAATTWLSQLFYGPMPTHQAVDRTKLLDALFYSSQLLHTNCILLYQPQNGGRLSQPT